MPNNAREEFNSFIEGLADSIMDASDEDLLEETREAGEAPAEIEQKVKALLHAAVDHVQEQRRHHARAEYERRSRELKRPKEFRIAGSFEEKRAWLNQVLSRKPVVHQLVTVQFRDLGDLTEGDVDTILGKLDALGLLDDHQDNDTET